MTKNKFQDRKQLIATIAIAVLATLAATLLTRYLTFLSYLENVAADIRVAVLQPPMPQSKDIAVVAITEETLAQFPYRSPVDRAFLSSLLKQLEARGAKVIGLDVLLDQPTESAKDVLLAKTIRELKTPLLISYTNDPEVVNEDQLDYLNQFFPEPFRGAANLATDPLDGSVRWIFPGETRPDTPPSFARKAVALMGLPMPPAAQPEIIWRPGPDAETPPFPIYPAHAVAALPKEWFTGKLLLIGASLSITDRHRTPMAVVFDDARGRMPGVVIQAHSISQLLESRGAQRLSPALQALTSLAFAVLGVIVGLSRRSIAFTVTAGVIVLSALWLGGILGYRYGLPLIPLIAPSLAIVLSLWMMDMLIGRAERRQREFVQGAFSRYVSPVVVEQLIADPSALNVTGKRQEASFIFTDIAGFTTLSEKLPSDQLSDLLNAYLDGACSIIQKHEGTVDKFIGDAIMSVFNAPLPQPDHQERAVQCALELDRYAEQFREEHNQRGIPLGVTRIGVHSGVATIGNFGSQSRMDFTALGDTVNTASRTEGVNKYFGTRICCTEEVVLGCPKLRFQPIGKIVLKGKEQPIALYRPVGDSPAAIQQLQDYLQAYRALESGSPEAPQAFGDLERRYPDDPLVNFHAQRIRQGELSTLIVMEDK